MRPDTLPVSRMRRKLERARRQRNTLAARVRVLLEEKAVMQGKIEQALSYVTNVDRYHGEDAFSYRQRLRDAEYVLDDSYAKEEKRLRRLNTRKTK